jgi:hypothetical protein
MLKFEDVPLADAVERIADAGPLNVIVVSKLEDPHITATQPFVLPPHVSVRWQKITARQALLALAVNYDLTITPDKQTGAWRVEKRQGSLNSMHKKPA